MNFPLKVASNVEITNIFCLQPYLYRFNSFKQYMVKIPYQRNKRVLLSL